MSTTTEISRRRLLTVGSLAAAGAAVLPHGALAAPAPVTILNVSYDPTREFYKEFDAAFALSEQDPARKGLSGSREGNFKRARLRRLDFLDRKQSTARGHLGLYRHLGQPDFTHLSTQNPLHLDLVRL